MGTKGKLRKSVFILLPAAVCLTLLFSCVKKESFSEIPQIGFADYYNMFDTTKIAKTGVLTITFQDGDGDIGLNPWDLSPPFDTASYFYYDYFIDLYEKKNGIFVKDTTLNPPLRYRIPNLTPNDPNKAIKGIIVDTIPLNPAPVWDTIMFSMFIYDRALHKSNVVFTPMIIVRRP